MRDAKSNKIENEDYFRQRLLFGNIGFHMTDIDAFTAIGKKGFCFIEAKTEDKWRLNGQISAIVSAVHSMGKDKPTVLVIAEHPEPFEPEDTDLATCSVHSIYVMTPGGVPERWIAHEHELGDFNVNDFLAAYFFLLGVPYKTVLPTDTPKLLRDEGSPFVVTENLSALAG